MLFKTILAGAVALTLSLGSMARAEDKALKATDAPTQYTPFEWDSIKKGEMVEGLYTLVIVLGDLSKRDSPLVDENFLQVARGACEKWCEDRPQMQVVFYDTSKGGSPPVGYAETFDGGKDMYGGRWKKEITPEEAVLLENALGATVEIPDIIKAYKDNEFAANEIYKGKTLIGEGVVDKIATASISGKPTITMGSTHGLGGLRITLSKNDSLIRKITAGSKIAVSFKPDAELLGQLQAEGVILEVVTKKK